MKKFLEQKGGLSCFVYAVANCLVYNDLEVPDLDEAFKIAACLNGPTIHTKDVVKYMNAPLEPVSDHNIIFKKGGVLNIMHPIWNGHSLFCVPLEDGIITVVNSWLGPNVCDIGISELEQFIPKHNNLGKYWVQI